MTSFFFCWRIFAFKLHARTTAPASRDLQENDIDVYVRLGSLATTAKKVILKMIENNFFFNLKKFSFLTHVVYFFMQFADGFWPLVNQRNDTIAYTNSFWNQYFFGNQSDLRERKERIHKSAWGSDRCVCLKILPSRQNQVYLWKMPTKVEMYSATHEIVTVARGQR